MSTPTVPRIEFELGVRKSQSADASLPDVPAQFRPLRGDYPTVSRRAVQLNDVQNGMVSPDYVFFAETAGPKSNPTHCDMCKRIAVQRAARDD